MGTIKDIVDLSTQLASSVKDRKITEELNQIQTLTLQLQSEQAQLHEKNIELREGNVSLAEKVRELEAEIVVLNSSSVAPEGVPSCPNCSTSSKPYLMSPIGPDFKRMLNATHECAKCKYRATYS